MQKKYSKLVDFDQSFFSDVLVKIPIDFEKQAGSKQSYEFLQKHLKSKELASRIANLISIKENAQKELAKVTRSIERNIGHIQEDIEIEELSEHYIKLRALVEQLKLKVPDIERVENFPLVNMFVQQELMTKLKFNFEEETDLDSPLYEEIREFTSSFNKAMEPMLTRPAMEPDIEDEDPDLLFAMHLMQDPESKSPEELLEAARLALSFSPYCLPAYMVLLNEPELSDMEKYALSDKAIEFIEEFLGEEFLDKFMGDLCSSPEGLNYMMIRDLHASSLLKLEMYPKVVESIHKSFDYDSSDSFGLRYKLLTAYTHLQDYKEARKLMFRFNDPEDLYFQFGKLLLEIIDKGETETNLNKLEELKSKYPRVWQLIEDEELNLTSQEQKLLREDHEFELAYHYALWNQEFWWDLELAD